MNLIVAPEALADTWPKVERWLAAAVDRNQGDENLLDVLLAIARGHYLLWHEDGKWAAVVQIVKFPRQTVATVLYCGGSDLEAMKAAFEYGRQWAREHGIDVVRTYGRKGWARVIGLEQQGVILQAGV
ncbi:MAG TPA: hypothetical protein VML56_03570 [Burkholderiales bacterium]|nr:hypothetical protein [Burkholderiales bacterium]